MNKLQLRKCIIEKLNKITKDEKRIIERKLLNHLVSSKLWYKANTIGLTIAQGFEWDTEPVAYEAWKQNKLVCVPKCSPQNKTLTFYQIQSYDQLEVVYYNLLEPKIEKTKRINKQSIDLLIVPGILFDKQGFRIGFGGGYYDRFLSDFPNKTLSLASELQLIDHLPTDIYDIPVNHIITEHGILKGG